MYGEASKEHIASLDFLIYSELNLGKNQKGIEHLERIETLLNNTHDLNELEKQSYFDKLKYVYLRLNIKKDVKGNNSIATENSFILDATNDFVKGRVDSAISKFRNLLDYYDDHFDFADIGNYILASVSLSNALVNTGNYAEADSILNGTIRNLKKKNVDSKHIRSLYEAKGYLYHTLRNVDMALFWYNKAIGMYSASEENSLPYCMLISNLSVCQLAKENFELAKTLSDKAYKISAKFYGDNSNADDRLLILNNLATIYTKLNEFSKGEELYKRVIVEATSQQDDRTKAIALINLSEINLLYKNDLSNAEKCLHEVMKMDVASFIKETAEMNLLFVQILQEEEESLKALASYNDRIKNEMANMFEHFSEAEREEYWTHKSQSLLLLNNLSAMTFNTPQSLKMAYNNTIYTKNMLINSGKLLGQLVNDCSSDIQEEYTSMVNMKIMLSDKHITKDSIDIYREKISQKEKGIIASIPNFGNKLKTLFKTCDDVQRMLSDNEIAIEFISLPQKKPPFDENLSYAAMLQTKSDTIPILIQLCSESELENIMDTYNNIGQKGLDSLYASSNKSIYQMIWKKLEPYIPVGSTIYYSPTGYISKINLSAISNGYNRLSEVYSFHEVSSTGIIDKVKHGVRTDYYDAAIYGDINYYEDIDLMAEKAKAYTSYTPGEMPSTRSLNRGTWDLIPGTKEEIETISELFRDKGLKTYVLTQNDANEESFKALDSNAPALIHIATHGFYIPQEKDVTSSFFNGLHSYTQKDYSMLYSGLLFAGGNNAWTGKEIEEGVEDGILTAKASGSTDISVETLDGGFKASCNIVVYNHTTGIQMPKTMSMRIGEQIKVNALTLPLEISDNQMTFSCNENTIAKVTNDGTIIGLKQGTCTITATSVDGGYTAECVVTVLQPVEDVTLEKHSLEIKVGDTENMSVQVLPTSADNKKIVWTSSDEQLATVNSNGQVTALQGGTVWIKATAEDNKDATDSCRVTVMQPVTGIKLSKSTYRLINIGDTTQLEAIFQPNNATNKETKWQSSNESVCYVSNGNVVATGYGTAVIMAVSIDGNYMASCVVNVGKEMIPVESIELSQTSATLTAGETMKITATVKPDNATEKQVVWTSSDETTCLISQSGMLVGIAEGTVTITATSEDGKIKTECNVRINARPNASKDVNNDGSVDTQDVLDIYQDMQQQVKRR